MIGDRPTAPVASAEAITTSRLNARNNSGLLVRAAEANRRGSRKRPIASMMTTTSAPFHSVPNSAAPLSPVCGPNAPRMKMIGTSAMSSSSSIARALRPTGLSVPAIGSTSAVEDSASAMPSPAAPLICWPIPSRIAVSNPAQINSLSSPSPNTWLRIAHSRANDNSRPISNSSRITPNSANGPIASGLVIVTK